MQNSRSHIKKDHPNQNNIVSLLIAPQFWFHVENCTITAFCGSVILHTKHSCELGLGFEVFLISIGLRTPAC